MKPEEIKAALIIKRVSQTEIARQAGCSRALVSAVINGDRTNRDIRIRIAKAIEKKTATVFPNERYREPYGRIVEPVRAAA